MNWISIGIVAGSFVFGHHDTKEQCLGRVAVLAEQKITAKCVEAPSSGLSYALPCVNCLMVGPANR